MFIEAKQTSPLSGQLFTFCAFLHLAHDTAVLLKVVPGPTVPASQAHSRLTELDILDVGHSNSNINKPFDEQILTHTTC